MCLLGAAFRGTAVDRTKGAHLGGWCLPTAVQRAIFPHLAEPISHHIEEKKERD